MSSSKIKKLTVCHIITRMIVGGAQENTLLTIIDHIEKGHNVVLITGESEGPEGELLKNKKFSDFRIITCKNLVRNLNIVKDIKAYYELKQIILDLNPDVVHTHSSKAGILGRVAANVVKVPFICHTVHGQAFHRYEKAWKNYIYIHAEKWAAKKCDKIYAVAEAMIKQCVDAGVAPKEKYMTVYSGMELNNFVSSSKDKLSQLNLRQELSIPEDAKVIVTVARLFPLKGYEFLVPAAEIITEKFKNTYFLVVGNGIMMESIKKEVSDLGLNFIFVGLVPPDEVGRYISIADFMIHLSLREGLPRTIVQSLACGKPAIAFDLDGAPEVIKNDRTGYIAEPENYIQVAEYAIKLLNDEKLVKDMGENGRNLVCKQFSWRQMGDILEKEYEKGVREKI